MVSVGDDLYHIYHKIDKDGERRRARETILKYYYTQPPCSCGSSGGWTRVAYLNMSDPSQQCPSNWRLTNTPVKGCGRSSRYSSNRCDSVFYPVNGRTYSSVCGRVFAYQYSIVNAFYNQINDIESLYAAYVSGVSITHGLPGSRQHIWTFAAAYSENCTSNNRYRFFLSLYQCRCQLDLLSSFYW